MFQIYTLNRFLTHFQIQRFELSSKLFSKSKESKLPQKMIRTTHKKKIRKKKERDIRPTSIPHDKKRKADRELTANY